MTKKNKNLIDFTWRIREKVKESDEVARTDIEIELQTLLRGHVVRFKCYERLGISATPELKDYICTVERVEVNSSGYGIVITTDRGKRLSPHSPFGIEVITNDKKAVHK